MYVGRKMFMAESLEERSSSANGEASSNVVAE